MNMRLTNLAQEQWSFSCVEKTPIFDVRRNPHTNKYAVFYAIGPGGKWKELTGLTGSTMGEPSSLILKRTRFKFIAMDRMTQALDYAMRFDEMMATESRFLSNAPAQSIRPQRTNDKS